MNRPVFPLVYAAIGRPSLLIPFPYAADDHQAKNAEALAELGASICVRQEAADEARIAGELSSLIWSADMREGMARKAREHGHPHAAHDLALDLLDLAKIPPTTSPAKTNVTPLRKELS